MKAPWRLYGLSITILKLESLKRLLTYFQIILKRVMTLITGRKVINPYLIRPY